MKKLNLKGLSKKQKIAIIVSIAVVVGGGFTATKFINRNNSQVGIEGPMIDLYTIPGKEKVFIKGKIVPKQSKTFSLTGEGEMDKMNVKDGSIVKKGDLLFSTKNSGQVAEITNLNNTIARKQKEKEGLEDEEAKKAIDSEIADLNGQVSTLKSTAYKSYYAPFEGKIYLTESTQETQGEGSASLMVLETTDYYITGDVNEYDLVKLKVDQEVNIKVLASKASCVGKISQIGDRPIEGSSDPYSMQSSASFAIKIDVEDQKELKNGFNIQAVAEFGASENKVPIAAIKEEEGKTYVMKIVDDIPVKAEVTVKSSDESIALISEGLNENDVILRDANAPGIVEGQNIYEVSK